MTKQILQIDNTNNEDFKNEILEGVRDILSNFKNQDDKEERLLTREETAEILSISLVTLWKWTKTDVIPAFRIGSKVRYKKSQILTALEKMNQFQ
ncbi:helix-turn-helix domain-containing protein [Winogradskyella sediminis]|uniref:helix-turn-helix domain-containing protein n=1 Tax=Winogradskyella sediminis TaxID=1382466 RepID=UPI000E2645B5|nr:helix-turn-helix domain-containing protein [Winogradskyella sediminis]REG89897.1 excisionase family DNA binding protein [Winogradskyella sediminis]